MNFVTMKRICRRLAGIAAAAILVITAPAGDSGIRAEAAAPAAALPAAPSIHVPGIVYHPIADQNDSVTFTFAGDILMDPGFVAGASIRRYGLAGCFDAATLQVMQGSDVFMLNNEFTYTTSNSRNNKKWTFKAAPGDAARLHEIGTDIVSLANNHTFDFNEPGFLDTLSSLEAAGVPYVGAGRDLNQAIQPYYYQAGNMTVAIVSATQIERYPNPSTRAAAPGVPGVFHCYDPSLLYQTIADAKTKADYVIVFIHWGTEQQKTPDASQRSLAAGIVNAGADLIIGGHSHCLQTIDYIGDVPVIYSLGNYVFANYTRDTCLVRVTLAPSARTTRSVEFIPLKADGACRVSMPTGSVREAALGSMRSISPNVTITPEGFVLPKGGVMPGMSVTPAAANAAPASSVPAGTVPGVGSSAEEEFRKATEILVGAQTAFTQAVNSGDAAAISRTAEVVRVATENYHFALSRLGK